MNLDEQMIRLANGDTTAFDEIYRETRRAVYYTALSVVRERSLAEDVMQSCFLSVIRNSSQYISGTNAKAWILRIARNEALNLVKKRARETSVDEQEDVSLFGTQETEYGYVTDVARKTLREDEFTIVMLVAVEGYKRREIAEILGIPLPTVTWKYHRAIGKLRRTLEKEGKE